MQSWFGLRFQAAVGAVRNCALAAVASLGITAGAAAQIAPNIVMTPHAAPRAAVSQPPAATPITAAAIARTAPTGAAARRRLPRTLSLSCTPPAAPDEIVELARALDWNPDLIYEYVHNNIDTIPIYDSLKGPLGTLIDGAGTPIDQAELMYVLLQQSCYSPQYEMGTIYLTATQLTNWLGTDTDQNSIEYVLETNGFPALTIYVSGSTVTAIDIPWVWVSVPIPSGGTSYQFDPASKTFQGSYGYNTRSTGVANLGSTALRYTQSTFISDAESGATGIGTPSVSGINRTNVRRDLTTYSNNLIAYIKANDPAATTSDIIGGSTIDLLPPYTPPTSGPTEWGQTVLCNIVISGTCYPNGQKVAPITAANLNTFRTTLTLTLGSNNSSGAFSALANPVTFNSSDIYGRRLSIMFDPSTNVPTLLLDGATQVAGSGTVPSGLQLTVRLSINHPHIPCASVSVTQTPTGNTTNGQKIISNISDPSCPQPGMSISGTGIPSGSTITAVDLPANQITISNAATATNSNVTLTIAGPPTDNVRVTPAPGAVFVVGTAWGGTGRGMIEKHRKLLRRNAAAQNPPNPNAESVLGEGLAMIGYTWLAEYTRIQQRVTELTGAATTYPHAVGIIGMKPVEGSQGPFVDLPINILSLVQRTEHPQSSDDTPAEMAAFFVDSGMSSVLESGSLEQTQPNATAASTVKLLDLWSQSGAIFDINDPEISGDDCDYYKSNLRGSMTSYGQADQARIDSLVGYDASSQTCGSSTTRVIATSNGSLTIGLWTGTGYVQVLYDPTRTFVTDVDNIITGGLSGGEPASPVPPAAINDNQAGSQSGSQYTPPSQSAPSVYSPTNTNIAAAGGGSSRSQQHGGDPVDLVTGSYVYNHQDLSGGSGAFPDNLPFVRYFDSALAQSGWNSSLLGNGWMHNYDMTALPDSDGFEGMGDNSPTSGAVSIAALYVLQDILNLQTSTAKPTDRIIIAAQAEVWLMQQLTNNMVSVVRPGSIERFTLLPNGAYNPPLGAPTILTGSSSAGYTYQSGAGVTLAFNPTSAAAPGKISGWSNAAGATVDFSYNGLGQLQSVCEPNCTSPARQLNLIYTGNQLTFVNDDTGSSPRVVNYSYDSGNDLTGVTDPLGNRTTFAYGAVGQLTRIFYPANPGNAFVSMTYDTLGRPNQQADANGNVTILKIAGTRAETDDPGGTARVSYFNAPGQTVATIDGLGSATIDSGAGNLTSYGYDGLGRVLAVTQPLLGSQTYTYDSHSNPLTITSHPQPGSGLSPLVWSFTYITPVASLPGFEEVQTATDPLGLVTTYGYDQLGNRTRIVADAGGGTHFNATSSFAYDGQGRILTATDPLGTVTRYSYDKSGNRISIIGDYGRLNQTTLFSYDAVGNASAMTDPNGNVTANAWDADRRLTSTTSPPAAGGILTTAFTYDPNGELLQTRQSSGGQALRTSNAAYTLADKLATSTDANGNVTRYAYDTDDRLARVTDAAGRVTTYGYDALGRRIGVFNPAIQGGALVALGYTPDGRLASLADASSHTTGYAYDRFDRLAVTTFPDNSSETLGYDADSNVLSRKTRKGDTIAFTYDTLNRLSTKAAPGEATVSYAYDLAGHPTSISDTSAAIALPAASESYTENTSYDALNRPLAVSWSPAPAPATPTASGSTFAYGYDPTNRRITGSASDTSWWSTPSAPGTTSYTANNLDQYSKVASVTPTYDADGNLTYDGTFTYGYDAENRLVSVKQGGTSVASYTYDAQGRRKSKTVGSTTTLFVTDADNREVLEYDGMSGALERWYAFGQGPDAVLGQMNLAAGTRETMIPDIQGSIIGALDSGTGALTKSGYQAYGENPTLTSGTYRYTAQRFDPETAGSTSQPSGLYYYRARTYSPTWGRFLQPDPLGYAAGPNLYAYVNNDPLNRTDPSGLWGFGLQGSASVEGGVLVAGAGATGSVGGGVFGGGPQGLNVGTYASGGAVAGGPGYGASYPGVQPGGTTAVAGAAAGGGGGIFFTNATSAAGLSGPFNTYSLNTPIGSIQFGQSGGTWIVSITCGMPPCGIGTPTVAVSTYPTNTVATPPLSIPSPTPPAAEPSTGFSSFSGGSNSPSK